MRSQRWRRICVVSGCGKFQVANSRCDDHAREYEAARGTRHERGYDSTHDADRVRLLAKLKLDETRGMIQLCWRCLEPMNSTQDLDADHSKILASAGGRADCLTHASCNRGKRTPS